MTVSVIIPLYNKANYIKTTIESVLAQTYKDLEVIVVDDGSTDSSTEIVENIADDRIRLIRQSNAGVSAARNAGLKEAEGEWIAFLDADDEWLPAKLADQTQAIKAHQDLVWSASGFVMVRDNKIITEPERFDPEWFESDQVLYDALLAFANGKHLWTGTVMAKRQSLLEIGGFDTSLITGEDIDLCFRLAVKHPKIIYLSKGLAKYNIGLEGALTTTGVALRDVESVCILARRVMSYTGKVKSQRVALLKQFAKRLILVRINCLLFRGDKPLVRKVLKSLDWLDLGFAGKWLLIKSNLPAFIFKIRRMLGRCVRRLGLPDNVILVLRKLLARLLVFLMMMLYWTITI